MYSIADPIFYALQKHYSSREALQHFTANLTLFCPVVGQQGGGEGVAHRAISEDTLSFSSNWLGMA